MACVELNPYQSELLMRARYAEQARVRHEAEYWPSQAKRDADRREMFIAQLLELGVPRDQIDRFMAWEPS